MNCVNEAGNTLPLDQFNTKEISFAFFTAGQKNLENDERIV